jgi:hypothetical protein
MPPFRRLRLRQLLTLLAALAFGATGPGLSGAELVAHLSGLVDLSHQRGPHFESAGQSGHTDHCQLGLVSYDGRLPAAAAPLVLRGADLFEVGATVPAPLTRSRPFSPLFPRAPPV